MLDQRQLRFPAPSDSFVLADSFEDLRWKIVALEHPRFIMQYRSAKKSTYIDKYISAFKAMEH